MQELMSDDKKLIRVLVVFPLIAIIVYLSSDFVLNFFRNILGYNIEMGDLLIGYIIISIIVFKIITKSHRDKVKHDQ